MKVNPDKNFPVSIHREDDSDTAESVRHLFAGIYRVSMNFSVDLMVVPSFDLADLDYGSLTRDELEVSTYSEARADAAVSQFVVTPNEELAGQDVVVPVTGIPDDAPSEGWILDRPYSVFLYVSNAEFEVLVDEIEFFFAEEKRLWESDKTEYEIGDLPLALRLRKWNHGEPIDKLQHLNLGRFIQERFWNSPLVDVPMLGK